MSSLGPLIGGGWAGHNTWQQILICTRRPALAVLFLFRRVSRAPRLGTGEQRRPIDRVGNAVIVASTTRIQAALAYLGLGHLWGSPEIVSLLAIGLALLVLLPLRQLLSRVCPIGAGTGWRTLWDWQS